MRRKLLILALGILFLIVMVWIGTTLTEIIPRSPSAQIQTSQAGPYKITMQVNPNPPSSTQPATLAVQVVRSSSLQLVTNARVTIESTMETMDMGTDSADAHVQNNGTYSVPVQFSMSGPWQVRILISVAGSKAESAVFEVVAR